MLRVRIKIKKKIEDEDEKHETSEVDLRGWFWFWFDFDQNRFNEKKNDLASTEMQLPFLIMFVVHQLGRLARNTF